MFGIFSIPLFVAIFHAVASRIPEHCMSPPPGVTPADCCKFPRLFSVEDFRECDIEDPSPEKPKERQACSKQICLLKKYNLMKDDENIDKEAVGGLLDKVGETNPEFKDAMTKAKEKCLNEDLPGPPQICAPKKLGRCIMFTTFSECPMEDNPNCKKLKDHMDQCKGFSP